MKYGILINFDREIIKYVLVQLIRDKIKIFSPKYISDEKIFILSILYDGEKMPICGISHNNIDIRVYKSFRENCFIIANNDDLAIKLKDIEMHLEEVQENIDYYIKLYEKSNK